jgi:hypothetical protein
MLCIYHIMCVKTNIMCGKHNGWYEYDGFTGIRSTEQRPRAERANSGG